MVIKLDLVNCEYFEKLPMNHPEEKRNIFDRVLIILNTKKRTAARPVMNIAVALASICCEHSNVAIKRPRSRAKL